MLQPFILSFSFQYLQANKKMCFTVYRRLLFGISYRPNLPSVRTCSASRVMFSFEYIEFISIDKNVQWFGPSILQLYHNMYVDIEDDGIKCLIYPFNNDNSSITVSHYNYWLSCSFGNKAIPHIDKVLFWGFTTLKEKTESLQSFKIHSTLKLTSAKLFSELPSPRWSHSTNVLYSGLGSNHLLNYICSISKCQWVNESLLMGIMVL